MLSFAYPITSSSGNAAKKSACGQKRPYGYWKSANNISKELQSFASESDEQWRMPTQAELLSGGRSDIAGAIRRQGSWGKAAENAGLVLTSIARPRSLYLTFCTEIKSDRMRPYMYWRDLRNLRTELRDYIALHGGHGDGRGDMGDGRAVLPSAAQLDRSGRSDLMRAIRVHGGFERVAQQLDYRPRYHSRKYWENFDNLQRELLRFVERFGEQGVMPPVGLMRLHAVPGLAHAVVKQGGCTIVARKIGLRCRFPRRPSGYWKIRDNRVREFRAFLEELRFVRPDRDFTVMPSSLEMIRMGRADLVRAICRYEGFSNMAVAMGLVPYGKIQRTRRGRRRDGQASGAGDGSEELR